MFSRLVLLCCASVCFGQALVSTRLLSGSGSDRAGLVATDKQGFVYVAGSTTSPDFPVSHALQAQIAQTSLRFSVDGRVFTSLPLASAQVSTIASSSDGQVLFAATPRGVFRSGNAGAMWTLANNGLPATALTLAVDPTNPQNAYGALTNGLIYRTVDGGANWQPGIITRDSQASISSAQLAINPRKPTTLYALTGYRELLKSTDSGATWNKLFIPETSDQELRPDSFALAPSEPDTLYVTSPLAKSTDGGVNWKRVSIIGSQTGGLAIDPRDASVVWIANAQGVSRSGDGGANFEAKGLAGNPNQVFRSIAVDAADSSKIYVADNQNAYATSDSGATFARVASGDIQSVYAGPRGVFLIGQVTGSSFVTKFDPSLSQIVYSTFFGPGALGNLAVDTDGNVYLAGNTQSPEFPTTTGAFQRTFTGESAGFVAKLSADGSKLLYSTVLNGLTVRGLAIDAEGNATIVGAALTGTVPVTKDAAQSAPPGVCTRPTLPIGGIFGPPRFTSLHTFVARLNPDASALLYATYLTGTCGDWANAVTLDAAGAAYLTGETYADDFPVTPGAMLATLPGQYSSGFVARLSPAGDRIEYASYFGAGYYAVGRAIALDASGAVIIAGTTQATSTPGAFQRPAELRCPPAFGFHSSNGPYVGDEAFAMKLNLNAADPVFLSAFGGGCEDAVYSLSLDAAGNIWMAGSTASVDFSTRAPFPGLDDLASTGAFIAELSADGSDLLFAKIVGGGSVATGPGSTVYYAGAAADPSKSIDGGYTSAQLARIDGSAVATVAIDRIVSFKQSQGIPPWFIPPPIAPGQMVRLRGRGLGPEKLGEAHLNAEGRLDTKIGDVQVLFDGVPAPLVTVQANEIVCLTPFALDGRTSTTAQVMVGGKFSNQFVIKVAPQSADYVAVANADGSPNSPDNPAAIGSTVALYLSGLGQTDPPSADGAILRDTSIRPRVLPDLRANGFQQVPVFLGAAPGQVAGITQINVIAVDPGASSNLALYVGQAFARVYIAKP